MNLRGTRDSGGGWEGRVRAWIYGLGVASQRLYRKVHDLGLITVSSSYRLPFAYTIPIHTLIGFRV